MGGRLLRVLLCLWMCALAGGARALALTGEIGGTIMIPLGDEAFAGVEGGIEATGFGGASPANDIQRGKLVYSLTAPGQTTGVELVTEATFPIQVSPKAALFDDPVEARFYRGKIVSLVRVPSNANLTAGVPYTLRGQLVRAGVVTPLSLSGSLTLLQPDTSPGRAAAKRAEIATWLPAETIPRPALQLEWAWSGGPELDGNPPKFDDGANKLLGVDLELRYPARVIEIVRVAAPQGRELAIWSQDDGNGTLAIQAVSRDGMSVNHLEVVFALRGATPLDPSDRIDPVIVTLRKAVDRAGAPADAGRQPPWSLSFFDVTVR